MRVKKYPMSRPFLPKAFPMAMVIVLLMLLLPAAVDAAQYYVWGRVYSASPVVEGEEVPTNPLSGVPAGQVIGEDLLAQIPRNLVKVRVLAAMDGSELGSYTTTGPTISVKFIVEEMATSKVLLESTAQELTQWPTPNIRYLLVLESLTEIGGDREFATCPPGKYTGIFTRVGKIEVATEVGGITTHLIEPATGLVNVPASVANSLYIHPYQDAPLGGNLYMFGAFNHDLYSIPGIYYRIRIDNLDTAVTTYMDDPLVKTRYTVDLTALPPTVTTDRITLGPKTVGGTPNCYELTPLAVGNVFWSFPDLLALWSTGELNGNYRVHLEIVGLVPATDFVPVPDYTDLRVHLDNLGPTAKIRPLDDSVTGVPPLTHDTPLIYTPGPAVPAPYTLLAARLGAPTDYSPATGPVCAILEFTNPSQHLAFKLSAHHANGFMRYWHLQFKRNDGGYHTVIGKTYNGSTNQMEDDPGVRVPLAAFTSDNGFQDHYLYLNPTTHLDLGSPDGCGYRFVIRAATRATDGYNYLRWASDEDIHYLKQ